MPTAIYNDELLLFCLLILGKDITWTTNLKYSK